MTLVDSVDSVLMLYSYSGFPERGFALFEKERGRNGRDELAALNPEIEPLLYPRAQASIDNVRPSVPHSRSASLIDIDIKTPQVQESEVGGENVDGSQVDAVRGALVKENTMSGLGIILTLISILVAFRCAFIFPPLTDWRSFT